MNDADHAFALQRSHRCGPKKLTMLMRDGVDTQNNRLCACAPGRRRRRMETKEKQTQDNEEDAVCFEEEEEDAGAEEEEGTAGFEEDSGSGVEELRVEWLHYGSPCVTPKHALSPRSLPFATLRVLDLTGCYLQRHSQEERRVPFPCLEAMRLRRCRVALTTLQDMISGAPRLTHVRLEALQFLDNHDVYRLRCPAATVVVLTNCCRGCTVELDAPRLRRFHYAQLAGYISHGSTSTTLSLESPTTLPLDHVHLTLLAAPVKRLRRSLLSAVRHTRILTLTVFSLADLNDGYMGTLFSGLERLEIQELSGWCIMDHAAAAIAFVNLLSSCPNLRELRLKFSWRKYIQETNLDTADEMAAIADFSLCRSIGKDDADCCDDLEDDLHGRLSCQCRLDCLRRVVVEFDADELTCFQVLLLKFLTKNAGTLEEVVVDGGKGYDSSHIDLKVVKWQRKRKPRSLSPPPPPPLSEFPPLEAPPCLDGDVDDGNNTEALEVPRCLDGEVDGVDDTEAMEVPPCSYRVVYDDDDTEEEDDISPRHFIHSARKNKKGGSPECWSVKPKGKGLITDGWRGGGADGRRHRRLRRALGGGGDVTAESLPPVSLPAPAQRFPCSSVCSLFRSLRDTPPQPTPWRSLFERRGTSPARPRRVPLITELFCG